MGRIIEFLGLAKKAGKLEIGSESVEKAAMSGKVRLIMTAEDAGASAVREAKFTAEKKKTGYIGLPFTKAQLGMVLGRGSPGVLALTDEGFSKALIKKLQADRLSDSGARNEHRTGEEEDVL